MTPTLRDHRTHWDSPTVKEEGGAYEREKRRDQRRAREAESACGHYTYRDNVRQKEHTNGSSPAYESPTLMYTA
ncbi:hypothetical protein IFM46972_00636 [Aspergillus udagawae]|uniref:Uncharacterized protein n=1 Tax=Aspergillus udagawae TaxID=91492 RepID=A0A8H3N5R7_9EURO|nr:hypothetical protein IFM46972_00636 [Aspergillus udagawae]